MKTVLYDGSFEGLLTSVFDIYRYGFTEPKIISDRLFQPVMFGEVHTTQTDLEKATRVKVGLQQRISAKSLGSIYRAFLSEEDGIEDIILQFVRYVFSSKTTVEYDFANHAVLTINQVAKKVYREKHRMEAFVRFQLTGDNLYYATIEPDFNVLPLILKHFKDRYADQRWMIYDGRRKYGIYYDLQKVETVNLVFEEGMSEGKNISAVYDSTETLYQELWNQYFSSVNIPARKNIKLHIQHMPLRYWKYLPEKDPRLSMGKSG